MESKGKNNLHCKNHHLFHRKFAYFALASPSSNHKIASGRPSLLLLRKNLRGISHLFKLDTVSFCDNANDPVDANSGSKIISFMLPSFLISSNIALLVSIPAQNYHKITIIRVCIFTVKYLLYRISL